MPTKQQMLEKIYEVIAIRRENKLIKVIPGAPSQIEIYQPVMIGDVIDWMEVSKIHHSFTTVVNGMVFTEGTTLDVIAEKWKLKRLPIDDQDELLISYIFDLIPDKK